VTTEQELRHADLSEKSERLLARNEQALQALANAAATISEIQTDNNPSANELENWVAELERAVSTAHRMSVSDSPQDLNELSPRTKPRGRKTITPGAG